MSPKLKEKTLESLSAVLPITGIMLIIGMGFFQPGAEMSMTPIDAVMGI